MKFTHQQGPHHPEVPSLLERRNGLTQIQSRCQLGNNTTKKWVLSYNSEEYVFHQQTKSTCLPPPQSKHTGLVIKCRGRSDCPSLLYLTALILTAGFLLPVSMTLSSAGLVSRKGGFHQMTYDNSTWGNEEGYSIG